MAKISVTMWTKTFFCSMFQNKWVFPEYLNLSPRGELAVCNRMNLESTPPQSCDLIVQNHNCLLHILILKLQRSRGRRWVQDFFKGLMLVYPSMFGGIHVKQQIKKKNCFQSCTVKNSCVASEGKLWTESNLSPNMLCVYFLELHWFLPVKSTLFRIGGGLVMSQGLDFSGGGTLI